MAEPDTEEEICVFDEPECGPVVMHDNSGEPWCERCMERAGVEGWISGPVQ
jgi:hypothetical protein